MLPAATARLQWGPGLVTGEMLELMTRIVEMDELQWGPGLVTGEI